MHRDRGLKQGSGSVARVEVCAELTGRRDPPPRTGWSFFPVALIRSTPRTSNVEGTPRAGLDKAPLRAMRSRHFLENANWEVVP